MGRKSNAKKIIRELIEEKEKLEKKKLRAKKSRKEIKKEVLAKKTKTKSKKTKKLKKAAKEKVSRILIHKKLIFGAGLSLLMLALLIFTGFILFQKAFRAEPIAKLLPADKTIALIELNTDFNHSQPQKAFKLLKSDPRYSRENLEKELGEFINLDYTTQIKPWLGRSLGLAILNVTDPKDLNIFYFAEVFDREKLLKTLKNKEETYKKQKIYQLKTTSSENPQPHFALLGDYIFLSDTSENLKALIDSDDRKRLYSSEKYRRIDDNMPFSRLGFFYTNFENLNNESFKFLEAHSQNEFFSNIIKPFLTNYLKDEGLAIIALEEQFALQNFLSLRGNNFDNANYLDLREKYDAALTSYVDENTLMYWGGANLETNLKRFMEIFADAQPQAMLSFEKLLENYLKKYLGPDIDFKLDIIPLLKNEFAFVIEKPEKQNKAIYKVLFKLKNPASEAMKIQEIAQKFATTGAMFEPQVVDYELPDGTYSREIIAVPEEITSGQLDYNNTTVYQLEMSQSGHGIYYAIMGDIAVIAMDLSGVTSTIDLIKSPKASLRNTLTFSKQISPLLANSDELSFINFEKLLPLILSQERPELNILQHLSTGNNYFADGISSITYLKLK